MNSSRNTSHFLQSLFREIGIIASRPIYFIVLVAIPLFTIIFLSTIFGNGKIENVPVGVVDYTESQLSQQIIEKLEASAVLDISGRRYSSEKEAHIAMQKMEIYGFLIIPHEFDKQLYSGKKPSLTYCYQKSILATGEEVNGAFLKVLSSVAAGFIVESVMAGGVAEQQAKAVALPVEGISHPLYNHNLDFTVYITYPFIFVFLQILIIILTVYVLGRDKASPENIGGKLFPYFIIFSLYALVTNLVCFGLLGIPIRENLFMISAAGIMVVAASISMGVIIALFIPNYSIAVSIASMYGALGATMCGVTFPIEQMFGAVQALSYLFPIRYFTLIYHNIIYLNLPAEESIIPIAALAAFIVAPLLIPSRKRAYLLQRESKFRQLPPIYGVVLIVLGGTVGYGLLYNILYMPNKLKDVPVAVVDGSNTPISREFIRYVNATEGVEVESNIPDIRQAGELMDNRRIRGIIYIPHDFASRIYKGEGGAYSMFGTTSSLLYYLTIQESTTAAMMELNSHTRQQMIRQLPPEALLTLSQAPQIEIKGIPLYNKEGGYADFLIPAVLIVALFQTMLMAAGVYRGADRGKLEAMSATRSITGFTSLYFMLSLFVIGVIPLLFNLPDIGNLLHIFPFILLFLFATAIFATLLSSFYTDSESVNLIVPFFSVGLIFISGISFPREAMPLFWQATYYLLPCAPAITGYIKLNSMGADIVAASHEIYTLVAQCFIYGTILYTVCRTKKAGPTDQPSDYLL